MPAFWLCFLPRVYLTCFVSELFPVLSPTSAGEMVHVTHIAWIVGLRANPVSKTTVWLTLRLTVRLTGGSVIVAWLFGLATYVTLAEQFIGTLAFVMSELPRFLRRIEILPVASG